MDYLNLLREILKKAELRNDKEEIKLVKEEIQITEGDILLSVVNS
jgi:hypothetical protein